LGEKDKDEGVGLGEGGDFFFILRRRRNQEEGKATKILERRKVAKFFVGFY
jgi:hypothetical protein